MTTVFVVIEYYHYENSEFLGTFSTLENAKQMVKNYRVSRHDGYPIYIYQSTLDGDFKPIWIGQGDDYLSGKGSDCL
jgi:hypothetical protein